MIILFLLTLFSMSTSFILFGANTTSVGSIGAIVTLDHIGTRSADFIQDGGSRTCINSYDPINNSYLVYQTSVTGVDGYMMINENGTQSVVDLEEPYTIVAWYWSSSLDSHVIIGWKSNVTTAAPEIAILSTGSNQVESLVTGIPGSAFLLCACTVTDRHQFVYGFLDNVGQQYLAVQNLTNDFHRYLVKFDMDQHGALSGFGSRGDYVYVVAGNMGLPPVVSRIDFTTGTIEVLISLPVNFINISLGSTAMGSDGLSVVLQDMNQQNYLVTVNNSAIISVISLPLGILSNLGRPGVHLDPLAI